MPSQRATRPAAEPRPPAEEPPEPGPGLTLVPSAPDAARHLADLLAAASGRTRALVLTHDNPDPDALASAHGIAFLLEQLAGVASKVGYGGIVGRAENRALLKVLRLPATNVARLDLDDFDFVALVDTQPGCTNHSLGKRAADAVVDHHPARESASEPRFADVGGDFGATASIVTSYVRASGLTIPTALATALFYGIKSDTRDLGREFEPVDVDNYHWLFPQLDHAALSHIEHPSVPAAWFAAFHRAYGRARRHGEAVVADLGKVYAPDIVPELADRLLSLEEMRWSLVVGEYDGHLHVSIRTSDRRMNAGKLVLEILGERGGSAGGHGSMAGGRIALPAGAAKVRLAFRQKIVAAFVRAFGAPKKGETIV
jgi:nanoRNase/pAp phosphatase (c-di-AMP/oligoRNAs hydrolase)